jgi:hypothetical protein
MWDQLCAWELNASLRNIKDSVSERYIKLLHYQ